MEIIDSELTQFMVYSLQTGFFLTFCHLFVRFFVLFTFKNYFPLFTCCSATGQDKLYYYRLAALE